MPVISASTRLASVVCVSLCWCACEGGPTGGAPPELVLLTRDACVLTDVMRTNLDAALKNAKASSTYRLVDLASLKPNDPRIGYPTPTVLFADRDLFGMAQPRPPFPEPT